MLIHNGETTTETPFLNRSFKYGDGLFESLRLYEGKILFWEDHMARLFDGMKRLKMNFKPQLFSLLLQGNARQLIQQLDIKAHGRLRIHVYRRGKGAYGPVERTPGFVIEAFGFEGDTYHSLHPVSLTAYKEFPLTPSPLNGLKTANSLPYVLASIHAQDEGFDEALLFTDEGYVSEASSSNIFKIQQKKLITPPLSTHCLDGVMRKKIIELSHELKVSVTEKKIQGGRTQKGRSHFPDQYHPGHHSCQAI